MPPKGTKSPRTKSPKSAKQTGNASWEASLSSSSINQDGWTTFIGFLMPDHSINQIYIDLVERAMQQNVRRRFDLISKRDLVDSIKVLGKPSKNLATKSVSTGPTVGSMMNSSFFPAYEYAKTILDTGSEIDDQLWAKLIKCRILDLKKEVQNRTSRKTTVKTNPAPPGKGEKPKSPGGKKSPKGAAAAAKKPSPGGQLSAADTHIEKSTGVKTRDQIIDETRYIDDEPNDGPNQYIYLSGFFSLNLLNGLDNLGIRVDTVINMSCDKTEQTKRLFEESTLRERQEQTLKADVLKDLNKDSILTPEQLLLEQERNEQILQNFWNNLLTTLDNSPDQSMLQDLIITNLKVAENEVPESWVNVDQRSKLGQNLQLNVIENAFRMNIRKRQFKAFNEEMKLINVPLIEEKTIETGNDAKVYQDLLSNIPPESNSVPLILNSVLEHVSAQTAQTAPPGNSSTHDDIGRYIREKFLSLSMTNEQRREFENLVPKPAFSKTNNVGMNMVYHGDDIKQRLISLNRIAAMDPIKIEQDFLSSHSRLVHLSELSSKRVNHQDQQERQARLNQFLQFCTDDQLLPSDVDHILKQFIFECMNLHKDLNIDQSTEKIPSRPSSAGSQQEEENFDFEQRLANLNEQEKKNGNQNRTILWDDPYELLTISEQTGRIGLSVNSHRSSSASRSSKGSILRNQSQSPKRSETDAVFAVRFDVNDPSNNIYQQMDHVIPPSVSNQIEGTIDNMTRYHKRMLNDWNFAEHFEAEVFIQVVEQALITHSQIDVYPNRRDQSFMLVLSLPVPEGKSIGHENVNKKLFSDVGFRNFLDEISYEIVDWLRDEEAKYQAELLAQEVQVYVRQSSAQAEAAPVAPPPKKGKAAAGKKSPVRSRSATPDSGHSTEEEKLIRDDYVHPTSLKAWKQKKDKDLQDLDQQQQTKIAKRPSSGKKDGKPKSPRAAEKPQKPPSPREKSPKRSKSPKRTSSAAASEKSNPVKPYAGNQITDRFIGYNLGNRLLSAQCQTSHLLLPDGCFVRTRKDTLKRGSTCVSASLHRNKSFYNVQLINPRKNPGEQESPVNGAARGQSTPISAENSTDEQGKKRVADFAVFTAVLNNGIVIGTSNYDTKPPKVEPPPVEISPTVDIIPEEKPEDKRKDAAAKNKKKGKTAEVEPPPVEKAPVEPQFEISPFQRLTVSVPTGLVVTFYPETFLGVKPTQSNEVHRLVVKQFYVSQSKGFHSCEQSRLNAYNETSRIFDSQGNVLIFKRNGEVTVLQPDGGIFMKKILHQNEQDLDLGIDVRHGDKKDSKTDSKLKKKNDSKNDVDPANHEDSKQIQFQWSSITADGQLFRENIQTHEYEKVQQLRSILETNPKTNEQIIHREDKVIIVFRSDGSRAVRFPDGTRITIFEALDHKSQSPSEAETSQRSNSKTSFRKIPHVKIESSGYATVAFNCQTTDCRAVFSDGTSIDVFVNGTYSIFESEGEKFDINDNGDILFDFQQSIYGKRVQELLSNIEPSKCIMSQNGDLIFDAVDCRQTQYSVEASGETYTKENGQNDEQGLPLEMHMPRFFIVHEDGSGTELLRFKDLYSYLRSMDLDPSTAVVREPLLSNPKVTGATVMRPFQDEVHRRWATIYDNESIVPASLRNYTSATAMTRSYSSISASNNSSSNNFNALENAIGRANGKNDSHQFNSNTMSSGFSMQPALLEMPKSLEYRNFMEFPRLQDDVRIKLFNALKSYLNYVKDRADYHTRILPQDHRSRQEKDRANQLWRNVRPRGNTKDDLALLYVKTAHPEKFTEGKPGKASVIPLSKKFNISHVRDEIQQEKINREIRANIEQGVTVPYFQSEWGLAYLHQQPSDPSSGRESNSVGAMPSPRNPPTPTKSPFQSPVEPQRITQARKSQLTRSVSTEVEDNKSYGGSLNRDYENTYRPVKQPSQTKTHIYQDAAGNKRIHPIRIANGLKGSRPNAQPHTEFLETEEPVMNRPNNASIGTAILNNRPLRERRGCELFPDFVDFGVLKEGVTYGTEIEIKNVGIDACRFRVRQPPLGTGLRVIFQPGLLAAGMRRSINIELYAIIKQNHQQQQQQSGQSQGLYQLDQSIDIITETDIMHLPVRAKIASEEQFDMMFVNKDEAAGMKKTVRLLARKTPNTHEWFNPNEENEN